MLSLSTAIVIDFSWQWYKLQILLRISNLSTLHLPLCGNSSIAPQRDVKASREGAQRTRPPQVEDCETF